MPIVKISPAVTPAQREDPRFKELLRQSESFFNSPYRFNAKFREHLCLHEGAHAYFARLAGAINIVFHGPTLLWDSRPQYNCPAISKSGVSWNDPPAGFSLQAAKADIAGFICRREMTDNPNDQTAIQMDISTCRDAFDRSIGSGDAAFAAFLEQAEQSILQDLKSPLVQQQIWAEARRFEAAVFPIQEQPPSI
jgi:hypothetical protein